MKLSWIIKLNFLILGLFLCIVSMRSLSTRGLSRNIQSAFMVSGTRQEVTPEDASRISRFERLASWNWCQRPVVSIRRLGGAEVQAVASQNEKVKVWLENNCSLMVTETKDSGFTPGALHPVLQIAFQGGGQLTLLQGPGGLYRMGKKTFKSRQLDAAINNIDRLLLSEE